MLHRSRKLGNMWILPSTLLSDSDYLTVGRQLAKGEFMNLFDRLLAMFGVERMPWVIRVYLLLFLIVLGILIYSASNVPAEFVENARHPMQRLFEFSLDLLKIILGALLGSLSLAASHLWGKPSRSLAQTSESEGSE